MAKWALEQISEMLKSVGFNDITINKKENLFLVMGYK